jgi:NAD+ synthase
MQIQTQRAAAILETYLRERVKHRDTTGVILGLSGGLDSAVLATLAVRSVGSSRVRVLYLFDRDSSRNSEQKAEVIAGWLGLRLEKQDMTPAMQARDVYRPLVARFSNISALLNRGVAILYQRITGESPLVSILRHGSGECQDHTMKQKLYDVFVRPLAGMTPDIVTAAKFLKAWPPGTIWNLSERRITQSV